MFTTIIIIGLVGVYAVSFFGKDNQTASDQGISNIKVQQEATQSSQPSQ